MSDSTTPWYKDAIIYQVYPRGFYDSNGDGAGDLRGLTEKLDYLRELGVDCLWLMPIYVSPLNGSTATTLPTFIAFNRRWALSRISRL